MCSRCELELLFHLAWLSVLGKVYLFPKRDLISFVSKSISVLSALFQLAFFCVSGRYFTRLSVYLIRAGIGRKGAHVGSLPLFSTVLWINSDSCRAICLCCTLLSLSLGPSHSLYGKYSMLFREECNLVLYGWKEVIVYVANFSLKNRNSTVGLVQSLAPWHHQTPGQFMLIHNTCLLKVRIQKPKTLWKPWIRQQTLNQLLTEWHNNNLLISREEQGGEQLFKCAVGRRRLNGVNGGWRDSRSTDDRKSGQGL